MRKKALLVMLFSALLMALMPVLSASAQRYPLQYGYGFYEKVTGSGTLVVGVVPAGGHPTAPGGLSWTVIVEDSSGQILTSQPGGTNITLHGLPLDTYKVTFTCNIWTYASFFEAKFL